MMNGRKVVVVMPAYNAEKTLPQTFAALPHDIVDVVLLVDDSSTDRTIDVSRDLGIKTFAHKLNHGYGRNQKTCYSEALNLGADIVVMVHPDYQYAPELVTSMVGMLAYGTYDVALASRILGVGALKGGMPLYKYISNRVLTLIENLLLNYKLSEYHTGYRAFTREVLQKLPLNRNSDDFSFDNEMVAQAVYFGFRIGEISCPTKYFAEASSINFQRSVKYGIEVLGISLKFRLQRLRLTKSSIFSQQDAMPEKNYYNVVE